MTNLISDYAGGKLSIKASSNIIFMSIYRFEPLREAFNGSNSGQGASLPARKQSELVYQQLGVNSIQDLGDLKDKKVFLRVDLNVDPDSPSFETHPRVLATYNTLKLLLDKGAKVVITSHLSKEDHAASPAESNTGKVVSALIRHYPDLKEKLSFKGFAYREYAQNRLCKYIYLQRVIRALNKAKSGTAIFTENPRIFDFEKNPELDKKITSRLQRVFDFAIHDCFGGSHRTQFTTNALFKLFPFARKALGPSSSQEWENLSSFAYDAEPRSVALILGGEKFSTKVDQLAEMLKDNDKIGMVYLGGAFALAYLTYNGSSFGKTPIKLTKEDPAVKKLIKIIEEHKGQVKFRLPSTLKGIDASGKYAEWKITGKKLDKHVQLPDGAIALDQRPARFTTIFAKTGITRVAIIGPLGHYTKAKFALGTKGTVRSIKRWASNDGARKILICGGNTLEAISALFKQFHIPKQVLVSAGGGATMLAFARILRKAAGTMIDHPALKALRSSDS